MKIAHLADLHLGFTMRNAVAKDGMNQRWHDVMDAFRRAVEHIEDERPDVIVVAGDVFHRPSPSNKTILNTVPLFQRLSKIAPVYIVAGNHDIGTHVETGCLLPLLLSKNVFVIVGGDFKFPSDGGMTLCAEGALPPKGIGTLVFHGEVDLMPARMHTPRTLKASDFSGYTYVALGHYHEFAYRRLAQDGPTVCYAGATEYTSSDPWSEARSSISKGFVYFDTTSKNVRFVPTQARKHVDLVQVVFDSVGEARRLMAERVAAAPDGAVVRQVLTNVPRSLKEGLIDHQWLKAERKRLLSLSIVPRHAEVDPVTHLPPLAPRKRINIEERFGQMVRARCDADPTLDYDALVAMARGFLKQADDMTPETRE